MKILESHGMFYLAAASSDFYVPWESMAEHKIQSSSGPLDMRLAQTPKMLLSVLRKKWAPMAFCISFKDLNPIMAYKTYVVYRGRVPGIYATWEDCSIQVIGYKGSLYKGFASVAEAYTSYEDWVRSEGVENNYEAKKSNEEVKKKVNKNCEANKSVEEVKNKVRKNYKARNLFEEMKNQYRVRAGEAQANSDHWALTKDLINALLVVVIMIMVVILFKLVAF